MQPFKATLYGPDIPVVGTETSAHFSGRHLVVPEHHIKTDMAELSVCVGSFEHNELYIIWQEENAARWAVKPVNAEQIELAIATAPPEFQPQLSLWHKRKRHTQWVWGSLAGLAAVLVLSAGLLWWQYDNAVSWVADHVSIANEEKLGMSLLDDMKSDGGVIEKGAAQKAVADIGTRLTQGSRYHYHWYVKKDKTVNAFALPGGVVIVHSALIDKTDNADELAAVLAHEVQHVEQRHALKNMIHSLGWAAVLMAVLGDVNTATAILIHQAGALYFSRDVEDEADRLGYQALVRAKISPDGMVSMFKKLAKEPGGDVPAWISSHPATAERVKTFEQLLKDKPCADCKPITMDWKKVKADKALQKGDA